MLRKGSLVIHGDGQQTRDFVYVDDVVEALVRAATAPDVDRRVINVGSGTETSINELAETIGRVTGHEPHLLYVGSQGVGVRVC